MPESLLSGLPATSLSDGMIAFTGDLDDHSSLEHICNSSQGEFRCLHITFPRKGEPHLRFLSLRGALGLSKLVLRSCLPLQFRRDVGQEIDERREHQKRESDVTQGFASAASGMRGLRLSH